MSLIKEEKKVHPVLSEEESNTLSDEVNTLQLSSSAAVLGAQQQPGLYPGPGYSPWYQASGNYTGTVGAMSCCVYPGISGGASSVYSFWATKQNSNDHDITWSYSSNLGVNDWAAYQHIPVGAAAGSRQRMITSAAVTFGNTLYLFYTTPQQESGLSSNESYIRMLTLTGGVWSAFTYLQDFATGARAVAVRGSPLSAFVLQGLDTPGELHDQLIVYYRRYISGSSGPSGLAYAHLNTEVSLYWSLNNAVTLNPPIYPTFTATTNDTPGGGRFAAVPFNETKGMVVYQGTDGKLAYCTVQRSASPPAVTPGATLNDVNYSYLTAATVLKESPYSDSVHYFGNRSLSEGLSSRFISNDMGMVVKPDTALDPIFCSPYDPNTSVGPSSKIWACSCVFNGSLVVFYIFNNNGYRITYSVGFSAP